MKIVNTEPREYSRKAFQILAGLGEVIEEDCDRRRLLELASDADVVIVRLGHYLNREFFQTAKNLKVVVTATTGLNHIDQNAAAEHGVTILCLRGERAFLDTLTATAELAWALLLGLLRKLPEAAEHVRDGNWDRDIFKGRQLKDKVLGIVGYGRLGSRIAEYGRAFQMEVVAYDPYVDSSKPAWVRNAEPHR